MKLSVSLSEAEVEALDRYVLRAGLASRSAAVQRAIRLLSEPELEGAYADAFQEWELHHASDWEVTVGDGLDAPR